MQKVGSRSGQSRQSRQLTKCEDYKVAKKIIDVRAKR